MRRVISAAVLISVLSFTFLLGTSYARHHMPALPKTYQVTGPVLESTSDMIVVKKGAERWEIARSGSTKVTGDLKVGATVTVQYRMSATSVDVKK